MAQTPPRWFLLGRHSTGSYSDGSYKKDPYPGQCFTGYPVFPTCREGIQMCLRCVDHCRVLGHRGHTDRRDVIAPDCLIPDARGDIRISYMQQLRPGHSDVVPGQPGSGRGGGALGPPQKDCVTGTNFGRPGAKMVDAWNNGAMLVPVHVDEQHSDNCHDGADSERHSISNQAMSRIRTSSNVENRANSANEFMKLAKAFALCTAYAANCGGVATLTGTPPNIVLKGQADLLFQKYNMASGITFANWLVLGFPLSVACLVLTWLWLQVYYAGIKCCCSKDDKGSYESVRKYIRKEYDNLGPMSFAEKSVLVIFIILAALWVTRKPEFIPGWGLLFKKGYVGDSTPAILISVLLFVFPSRKPRLFCGRRDAAANINGDPDEDLLNIENYTPLLNWRLVNEKMAWGVLLLMGGGFAIADACSVSGLSGWISDQLTVLNILRPWLIGLLLSYIVAGITNFTSNSATATLFLPIVGELAIRLEIHPLYFMIPVAISASFAFMLPVGTPPNAIVFSTGYLQVKDMIVGGCLVNVVTVLLLIAVVNLYGVAFFGLDTFPMAALANSNVTGHVFDNTSSLTKSAYNISNAG
ncbi:hypothetical protein ScPMuIL_006716 [Solemya velum]